MTMRKSISWDKQYCRRNHDTYMVGRNVGGTCMQCCRESANRATKRKWAFLKEHKPDEYKWRTREAGWRAVKIKNTDGSRFRALDYDLLFDTQKGKCRLCQKHVEELKKDLVADHDHVTGVIRGLLCNECNLALGKFEKLNNENTKEYLSSCLSKAHLT